MDNPVVFVIILLVAAIFVFAHASRNSDVPIFSDIEECSVLDSCKTDRDLKDEFIKDLDCEKSYIAAIKHDSVEFQIFAYEFETVDAAKEYCANCWKADADEEYSYNFSSGMFKSEGIVMNGKNLYRIKCTPGKAVDVTDYLSSVFSLIYVNGKGFVRHY